MNTAQKLGGGYYAVFEGNSAELKIAYRAPQIHKIFNAALYETIAEHMIDTDSAIFDKRVGRYHVVVERDFLMGGYSAGCADIEDDWEEVETDFDEYIFEEHIKRIKEQRAYEDLIEWQTYDRLNEQFLKTA